MLANTGRHIAYETEAGRPTHSAPSLISPAGSSPDLPPEFADAIRNPANPHHYMVIRPVGRIVRVFAGSTVLAETTSAVRVLEAGNTLYDPVLYIPAEDVSGALSPLARTTYCPLKGDASYYAYGGVEVAWSYRTPFAWASALAGRRAFWADRVRIEEGS